jgi:protein SCO1/2
MAYVVAAGCSPQPHVWRGTAYIDPPEAPVLPESPSAPSPTDFAGRTSLVYFGYTQCPDFCPATLANVSDLFGALGAEAEDLRFYFVTVDPERDTPEVLADYLAAFDNRIIGVRPDVASLPALLSSYGATAFVDPAHGDDHSGVIAHTSRLFLVDQDGLLRAHYPYDTAAADLLADVRYLLQDV